MANSNFIERDGEILPAYTGVNQPRYPKHEGDRMPDHSFSASEVTEGQLTDAVVTDSEKRENLYWPTEEQRCVGQAAIVSIRNQHLRK